MFEIDKLILFSSTLIVLAIASSKFSARFGVPVLLLFMGLGMLAGSEGLGGVHFEEYPLAHAIGTVALAAILLDGGLSTPFASLRQAWKPSLVLATFGVLVTSLIVGLGAAWMLDVSLLEGLLLGAIVGSTDAAAVFTILRSGGVRLSSRLAATLEIESGSNDPMAIFLTIGLIEVLTGEASLGPDLLVLFFLQIGVGALIGLIVGFGLVWLMNRIQLEVAGLYPIFVGAGGFLSYGAAAALGGSGFLAIYLTGIVVGNHRIVFQRGVHLFHDAAAWLAQIVMFVMLGLLSFPSKLVAVAWEGLFIAVVLFLVARPLAVVLSLCFFRFQKRELVFLSWVGLKGAVPITLATFPFLFNLPGAFLIFNVVFFVVILSALVQGWTIPFVAQRLGVQRPAEPPPPVTLEISSLRHVDGEVVDYAIDPGSAAVGRRVSELALPEGAVIALVARQEKIIPPKGATTILPGDHVILVLAPGTRAEVDRVFGREPCGTSRTR